MAKQHLKRESRNIRPGVWYYEENGGLEIHVNEPISDHHICFKIPVASLRAYLRRKDK